MPCPLYDTKLEYPWAGPVTVWDKRSLPEATPVPGVEGTSSHSSIASEASTTSTSISKTTTTATGTSVIATATPVSGPKNTTDSVQCPLTHWIEQGLSFGCKEVPTPTQRDYLTEHYKHHVRNSTAQLELPKDCVYVNKELQKKIGFGTELPHTFHEFARDFNTVPNCGHGPLDLGDDYDNVAKIVDQKPWNFRDSLSHFG